MNEKWYAVYTKPRWEKKVAENFSSKQISSYCPLNKVVRQWSDRKKIVHTPLFTSYVFVRINETQIGEVKKTDGVINLLYWLGKPAVIQDEEIETIIQFLQNHNNVQVKKTDFSLNEKVKFTSGTLIDQEGTIVSIKSNTIKVALPSLQYVMFAEVEKVNVEKLK